MPRRSNGTATVDVRSRLLADVLGRVLWLRGFDVIEPSDHRTTAATVDLAVIEARGSAPTGARVVVELPREDGRPGRVLVDGTQVAHQVTGLRDLDDLLDWVARTTAADG